MPYTRPCHIPCHIPCHAIYHAIYHAVYHAIYHAMPYTLPYERIDKNTISCNAALSACEEGGVWGDAPALLSSNASERIVWQDCAPATCPEVRIQVPVMLSGEVLRVLDGECNPSQAHTKYINLDGIICVALSSFVCEWSAYSTLRCPFCARLVASTVDSDSLVPCFPRFPSSPATIFSQLAPFSQYIDLILLCIPFDLFLRLLTIPLVLLSFTSRVRSRCPHTCHFHRFLHLHRFRRSSSLFLSFLRRNSVKGHFWF